MKRKRANISKDKNWIRTRKN
uniref:Uncharacterized protein n=1 Tax=Arundo donax TaxID=35708 RepID=A0A0A8YLF8_ARUDO